MKHHWSRLLTRTWAGEGFLSSMRSDVGDKGEPRRLCNTSANAARPFASVVRLVHTDMVYENGSVRS